MEMGTFELTWRLLSGVLLFGANAFYVATEFALTRLRQFEPEELDFSNPGISKAWEMTETLEVYLTGCQVGISLSSVLLGVVAEPAITALIESLFGFADLNPATSHGISITLAVVLINITHTIWAEQTPTYLGIEKAIFISRFCAIPHYYWTILIYPLLWVGDRLTKATLALFGVQISRSWLEEEGEKERLSTSDARSHLTKILKKSEVPSDRRDEVLKALEIGEIPVKDIMVPRDQIHVLSTKKSFRENLSVVQNHMHTRYPLVGDSLDDFIGILYTPEILAHADDLLHGDKELDDFDRDRMVVPQDMSVSDVIDRFQEKHSELALVQEEDEFIGLVTLTDALEAIVGSVEDPLDLEE